MGARRWERHGVPKVVRCLGKKWGFVCRPTLEGDTDTKHMTGLAPGGSSTTSSCSPETQTLPWVHNPSLALTHGLCTQVGTWHTHTQTWAHTHTHTRSCTFIHAPYFTQAGDP